MCDIQYWWHFEFITSHWPHTCAQAKITLQTRNRTVFFFIFMAFAFFFNYTFFLILMKNKILQEAFLLSYTKLRSPACQSLTLVGFIKESSKQLLPVVPSWVMPRGMLPFALPDPNGMWQAVGSKTGQAWCLAWVTATYTTQHNNWILTNGWRRVVRDGGSVIRSMQIWLRSVFH